MTAPALVISTAAVFEPHGAGLVLRLDARHAERALGGSYVLVPDGTEDRLLDWDGGLIELLMEEAP
jgi:hypothetical protein